LGKFKELVKKRIKLILRNFQTLNQ